jgi:hypothetical protein
MKNKKERSDHLSQTLDAQSNTDILGSHSGGYEEVYLLGYNAV